MFEFKTYPESDYLYEEEIRKFQLKHIKKTFDYCKKHSKYYQGVLKDISVEEIRNLEDYSKVIPITKREELAKKNWDFVAVEKRLWRDILVTTGTTGSPIYIPLTENDIAAIAGGRKRQYTIAGVTQDDMIQITMPMSTRMWSAGLSAWLGNFAIGGCSLRFGPGFTQQQIECMAALGTTVVVGIPSYLLKIGETLRESKEFKNLKIKLVYGGGEGITNEDLSRNILGRKLEQAWGKDIRITNMYTATEVLPIAQECGAQQGYHLIPEMCYCEIVDFDTYQPVKPGEKGLVVLTPFNIEGVPLLRYAIGDVSFFAGGQCPCGRYSSRLGSIIGRTDDMVRIRGARIHPNKLEEIISFYKGIDSHYIEAYTDQAFQDQLRIAVATTSVGTEEFGLLADKIKNMVKERMNVNIEVITKPYAEILEKTSPLREGGKERRFFDLRQKK